MITDDYYTLNEKDELIFNYSEDNNAISLNLTDLYNKYDALINTEDYTKEAFAVYSFYLSYSKITLFQFLNGIILDKNNMYKKFKICSNLHLEKLLEKYNFVNPYFFSESENINKFITKENIETIDLFEFNVVIKDKNYNDYFTKLKYAFNDIHDKYKFSKGENFDKNDIFIPQTYELLSQNFNKYFRNNSINNTTNFIYLESNERVFLINSIKKFIKSKDNKDNIYAIYGPYGNGKSVVSLIIHKNIYLEGYLSLYINFKYYHKYIPLDEKIETLIAECFFLFKDFELLKELTIKLQNNNKSGIWPLLLLIKEFLVEKNIKPILIFDQYKKSIDKDNYLSLFQDYKIFLLSSINDIDVKDQIILKLSDKEVSINYHYYYNLISKEILENLIFNSEKGDNKDEIIKILEKFGFLPKFVFSFLYYYNTIYDLIFEEGGKIFQKMSNFFDAKKNYLILKDITNSNPLIYKREELINNIYDIPLKYIKYIKDGINTNKNLYYLNFAFSFCETIYKSYINFRDSYSGFFSAQVPGDIGINFETIIRTYLTNFKYLNIDGCIEVHECLNLDLTERYANVNHNYFHNKNNILIFQKKPNGRLIDFIIYNPKNQAVFLIQAKYKITDSNVNNKSVYFKEVKKFIRKFKNVFGIVLNKIYIIYISSFEFNLDNKEKVFEILERKQINCLFFSVKNKYFSFNFLDEENYLVENISYQIYPKIEFSYDGQDLNTTESIVFLGNRIFVTNKKDYQLAEEIISNLEDDSIEKKGYKSFIDFLTDFSGFTKDEISLFKQFIGFYSNDYLHNFIPNISLYFVHCKIKNDNIEVSSDIGLIYPGYDKTLYYVDLALGKFMTKLEYNQKFKKYGFFIGVYENYLMDN